MQTETDQRDPESQSAVALDITSYLIRNLSPFTLLGSLCTQGVINGDELPGAEVQRAVVVRTRFGTYVVLNEDGEVM